MNISIFLPVGKAKAPAAAKRIGSILGATVAIGKSFIVIDYWRIEFVQS